VRNVHFASLCFYAVYDETSNLRQSVDAQKLRFIEFC